MRGARSIRILLTALAFVTVGLAPAALPAAAVEDPAAGQAPAHGQDPSPAPTEESPDPNAASDPPADSSTAEPLAAAAGRNRDRREYASRHLSLGDRGRDVRVLQRLLGELNFAVRVDGKFGKRTRQSVRRYEMWQRKRDPNGAVSRAGQRKVRQLVRDGKRYRSHVFPVRGPHDYGGAGSRFGAPRPGRTHQGQDVAAAEGTPLVAVHEGRVSTRQYQAGGAGHYLVIRGRDGRDSVYMHMVRAARVAPGEKVMAGQRIGLAGNTGGSTGPHLHFELWTPHWYAGGQPFDPLEHLQKWDRRT